MANSNPQQLIYVCALLTAMFAAMGYALRKDRLHCCLIVAATLHTGALSLYLLYQKLQPPAPPTETTIYVTIVPEPTSPPPPPPPRPEATPRPTPPKPQPDPTKPNPLATPLKPDQKTSNDPAAGVPDPAQGAPEAGGAPEPSATAQPPARPAPTFIHVKPTDVDPPPVGPDEGPSFPGVVSEQPSGAAYLREGILPGIDKPGGTRPGPPGIEGGTGPDRFPPPWDPEDVTPHKVYFIRLKHGQGDWNAFADGSKRLLQFINPYVKAETQPRAYAARELKNGMINRKNPPTFIYLHCDDSFTLTGEEVAILRDYVLKGGFLFLDSRPDSEVRARIAGELRRITGESLQPLATSHAINSFLFKLKYPAIGENFVERRNYGVMVRGRLAAFYTPGHFMAFYAKFTPQESEYVLAQYQMGVNIMLYAQNQGRRPAGLATRNGANANVTASVVSDFFPIGPAAAPIRKPPPGQIKIQPAPGSGKAPNEEPAEIGGIVD